MLRQEVKGDQANVTQRIVDYRVTCGKDERCCSIAGRKLRKLCETVIAVGCVASCLSAAAGAVRKEYREHSPVAHDKKKTVRSRVRRCLFYVAAAM